MRFSPWARRHLAVCEFTEGFVRVLAARAVKDGRVEALGFSEVSGEGYREGKFRSLSDAAETIARAADEVAVQAGAPLARLAVNLDDPFLEGARVRGSSFLEKGLEGFRSRHVQEASRRALQSVDPSEKHLVYKGVAQILVDGIEVAADPIGIFGRELAVVLHLCFSESQEVQNLAAVIERAGMDLDGIFPSAVAALHGLLAPDEMKGHHTLVLANPAVCHAARFVNGALVEHRSFLVPGAYDEGEPAHVIEWIRDAAGGQGELLVAGEEARNEALLSQISSGAGVPVRRLAARLDGALSENRYAVLAGLVHLSEAVRSAVPAVDLKMLQKIRMRARSFAQEYF